MSPTPVLDNQRRLNDARPHLSTYSKAHHVLIMTNTTCRSNRRWDSRRPHLYRAARRGCTFDLYSTRDAAEAAPLLELQEVHEGNLTRRRRNARTAIARNDPDVFVCPEDGDGERDLHSEQLRSRDRPNFVDILWLFHAAGIGP